MQLKLIRVEAQVNYSFASGNDPSSDYRNSTELKDKSKRTKDTWQTTGTDRRSVASKLSYLGVSDAPIGCGRTAGLVPGSTKVICRPCRRAADSIGLALTGPDGGRARCTLCPQAGSSPQPQQSSKAPYQHALLIGWF